MSDEKKTFAPGIKNIMEKRKQRLVTGYNEGDFEMSYWVGADANGNTRMKKDYLGVVKYITALVKDVGIKGSVLDVGAGAGTTVKLFREKGFESQGCEFSKSGRILAEETFGIDLKICDLRERLPYQDNEFGYSTCLGVLSMIPIQYMPNAISEILRVTKYLTFINIGKCCTVEQDGPDANPHHLTNITNLEFLNIVHDVGGYDFTALLPPQKRPYGLGVLDEFAGIFSKSKKLSN